MPLQTLTQIALPLGEDNSQKSVRYFVGVQNGKSASLTKGVSIPRAQVTPITNEGLAALKVGRLRIASRDVVTPAGVIANPTAVWLTQKGKPYAPGLGCATGEVVQLQNEAVEKLTLPLSVDVLAGRYDVNLQYDENGVQKVAVYSVDTE